MKINTLLTAVFILVFFNAHAQIEQEIRSFTDSTALLINNGRKMVVKNLTENNLQKASEIHRYLANETKDEGYAAFYYLEDLYIGSLTQNWDRVSESMLNYQEQIGKQLYPESVEIATVLGTMLDQRVDALLADLHHSDLDAETQKTIELFLYLAAANEADEHYDALLDQFKKQYPDPRYKDFVSKFLPGKKLKAAFSFSFGSGVLLPTGNLGSNFKPNASFNMSMDLNINKVFTSLYMHGSSLKLKVPFSVTYPDGVENFNLDESFTYLDAGLKGGYFLVRNRRFHVAPYGSISGSFLESNRYDGADDDLEYEIFNSFTYGGGLHTEIKITGFDYPSMYGGSTRSYISFKVDGGYNVSREHYEYFRGNIPYLTGALVWGIGEF